MCSNIELTSSLDKKDRELELLRKKVVSLETVVDDHEVKASHMESELFNMFSDTLNAKKRKIRSLKRAV